MSFNIKHCDTTTKMHHKDIFKNIELESFCFSVEMLKFKQPTIDKQVFVRMVCNNNMLYAK